METQARYTLVGSFVLAAVLAVFTFVFTQLLNQQIADFPVFVLAALLPWQWTATAISTGTTTLVDNAPLITKVYFPRLLLPISVVASTMANFILALPALLLIMALFGRPFTPWLLYVPVIVVVQAIFLAALLLLLAPLHVYFRDTSVLVEVGLTAWFFMTPIFYPAEAVVPTLAAWMYRLNPMAAIIATCAPARAAATAWLLPLPPWKRAMPVAERVSPGRGKRSTRSTVSRL